MGVYSDGGTGNAGNSVTMLMSRKKVPFRLFDSFFKKIILCFIMTPFLTSLVSLLVFLIKIQMDIVMFV